MLFTTNVSQGVVVVSYDGTGLPRSLLICAIKAFRINIFGNTRRQGFPLRSKNACLLVFPNAYNKQRIVITTLSTAQSHYNQNVACRDYRVAGGCHRWRVAAPQSRVNGTKSRIAATRYRCAASLYKMYGK